jgi:hypothetical protein
MEIRDLLNNVGDINNDVLSPPLVPGPANLLKLTANEIYLGLLHTEIKSRAIAEVFRSLDLKYAAR